MFVLCVAGETRCIFLIEQIQRIQKKQTKIRKKIMPKKPENRKCSSVFVDTSLKIKWKKALP